MCIALPSGRRKSESTMRYCKSCPPSLYVNAGLTSFRSEAKGALEDFQAKTNTQTKGRFSNVLERLLRLRQV